MFDRLKKLKYGARVLLSRNSGQPETVAINGRPTVLMHAGEGTPFVYLHSTLGEAAMWLPFFQTWAKRFRVPGDALRKRLDRFRDESDRGYETVTNRGQRKPKYLYKLESVWPIIQSLQASNKRPSKKKS